MPATFLAVFLLSSFVFGQTPVPLPRAVALSALAWQAPAPPGERKYKLTIVEDASKFRRAKKGRASSEVVVRVTDENNIPVAGIIVSFSVPQLTGAAFGSGALTVTASTTSAGLASAGLSVTTAATTSFNISVAASVSGSTLTASIPVNAAAVAAAAGGGGAAAGAGTGGGGGSMSATTIGIIGAAVAGGAVAGYFALKDPPGSKPDTRCGIAGNPPCPLPGVRIGAGGIFVFGSQ